MALEFIGGSILSPVIQVLVDRLASRQVLGFFKSHKLDDGLLETLKETLNTVNGLLDDAEEKQITKLAVKNWLNAVKHAVYEAEDILEGIDYEYLRSKDSSWVRNLVPYLNPANRRMKEMGAELQRILEKLERLVKEKVDLRHIEGTESEKTLSEKTTPLRVNESDVYGRESDKKAIMEHLLTQHNTNGSNLRVVPIVGMPGIGKTTLAQLIYNDERVDDYFELKAWVWASQQFDVARIIKDVLDKINASTCRTKEPDESLMEAVEGKKLLLVLDDAWNIEYNKWDKLLHLLQYVDRGSKIVVTTRDEDVARVTQTVIHFHRLNVISDEDCWKLFERDAFSGVNSGAVSHLEAFGREIARKCKGLPLAAKTLGGLLHSVGDVRQWEKISNSSLWGLSNENIPPALTLSYYYLPSHLKRCFVYCAIFPKGYVFKKNGLITEWMAHGFLGQSRGVEEMEDIGEKYFDDLVSRSLFQQTLYAPSDFSMHDIVSDLAEYASGEFCFKLGINESGSGLKGDHSCSLPEKTRYLSITPAAANGGGRRMFRSIHAVQHLRAWFPQYIFEEDDIEELNYILPNLKRLRMLSLCPLKDISSVLLNSIGNLKYLRHLDLSQTLIKRLPESVSTLYYLQTLLLRECRHLMELPSNISNLVDLQHLDIEGTNLKEMPPKMGKLTKLRILESYIVGKDSGSSMKELGKLSHIRKKLSIRNLRDVANAQDALDANLKGKKKIEELGLTWDGSTDDRPHDRDVLERLEPSENVKELSMKELGKKLSHIRKKLSIRNLRDVANAQDALDANLKGKKKIEQLGLTWDGSTDDRPHDRDVLERLEPSENVKELAINGYGDTTFPGWLGNSSFSNMVAVALYGCTNCIHLPPLGQLPSLEELEIEGFDEVVEVGSEFYRSDPSMEKPFKSLKKLKFKGMKRWQKWNTDVAGAFPHLAKLLIEDCPELTNALPSHLPCLWSLYIKECPQLVVSIPEAPMLIEINVSEGDESRISGDSDLQCLHFRGDPQLKGMEQMSHLDPSSFTRIIIEGCSSFKCCQLDLLPQVSTLTIEHCLNLESLCIGERPVPALYHLTISHCPNLVSFPKRGLAAPHLTSLVLEGCLYLKSLPENMRSLLPSLRDLHLISLPEVDSFPEGGLPSKLNTLWIVDFIKLSSLSRFMFAGNDVESFDEETLPSTLTTLEISRLENLKSLDDELHHLTSLQRLSIEGCPKLESISEQALPSSLEYLYLRNLESLDYKGLHHLTSLVKLKIKSCPKVEFISEQVLPSSPEYRGLHYLTSLRNLSIESYPTLERISEQALPSSLECLHLCKLESLDCIGLQHLTSLHKLKIGSCPKLESLQGLPSSLEFLQLRDQQDRDYKELRDLTSLRKMKIRRSLKLESLQEGTLPSSLEDLEIWDLEDVEFKGFQHLTSLRELLICSSPKLESVPGEKLPSSLVSLKISDLINLKSVMGLHHLTSLRHLIIRDCPKLECLEPEKEPYYRFRDISGCPLLYQSPAGSECCIS